MSSIQTSALSKFLGFQTLHEGAGSGDETTIPFAISTISSGSNVEVSLYYGTVNNVLPGNITNTFTIANNVTRYVVVNCNMSVGQVLNCSWAIETANPSAPSVQITTPPTTCKVLIGIIVNGTAFKIFPDYNVMVRAMEAYRLSKSSPIPLNEIPFDIYFTYIVAAAASF